MRRMRVSGGDGRHAGHGGNCAANAAASPAPTPDPKEKLAHGAKTNVIFDKGGVQIAWKDGGEVVNVRRLTVAMPFVFSFTNQTHV